MSKLWKQEEIDYLIKNYRVETDVKRASEHLGRSEAGIKHKASRLKLKIRDGRARLRVVKGKQYWVVIKKRKCHFVHRTLGEKIIGRKLKSNEVVHHKNRDSLDNRRSNLQVMTVSEHMKEHYYDRELNSKGQFI